MTWLHDQNFLLENEMISINLFETDLLYFHSKSLFFVIFLQQETSQDQ